MFWRTVGLLLLGTTLPLARTVAADAEAPVAAEAAAAPFAFAGNAYDFLLFLADRRGVPLASDPDILPSLVKTEVEIGVPTALAARTLLEQHLQPRGFIVQPLALAPSVAVTFVTTPEGWAYLQAMAAMRSGNLEAMYAALGGIKETDSEFGAHCVTLRQALRTIGQRNQQMIRLEGQVRENVQAFRQAISALKTAEASAGDRQGASARRAVEVFAQDRYDKAVAGAEECYQKLDELFQGMVENNRIIGQAFDLAYEAGYASEAAFLFEHLYGSYVRFRALLGAMQREKMLKSERNLAEVPKEVDELRASLRATVAEAAAELGKGITALKEGDDDRALRAFTRAYWGDRTLAAARAGMSWCLLRRNAASLRRVWLAPASGSAAERTERLVRELREHEKPQLLIALIARRADQQAPQARPPATKVGSVQGLAVSRGQGELLPLSVRIESIASTAHAPADETGYWASGLWEKLKSRDYPVSFGDYGRKDPYMYLAATEAYKWLKDLDGALVGRMGLQVEFRELLGGKAGDSAGAAIGAASYSALRGMPLRQDVAVTGSIRGDGSVKGVGMVPEKVAGAIAATGVELVVVPKDNLGDLATLSVEQLCRITLVTANEMRVYLKYLGVLDGKRSEEQEAAALAIRALREAQAALLMGDRDAAVAGLVRLASGAPELYNVGRLLQLVLASRMAAGELAPTAALRKQVSEAATKQALAAPVQDFQLPRTTSAVSATAAAEPPPPRVTARTVVESPTGSAPPAPSRPAGSGPLSPLGSPAPDPAWAAGPPRLVLWNRLGSEQELAHSEVGPAGKPMGEGVKFVEGQFGKGITALRWPAGVDFGPWQAINPRFTDGGTVEFWWKPARASDEPAAAPDEVFVSGRWTSPWRLPFQLIYRWRESRLGVGGFDFQVSCAEHGGEHYLYSGKKARFAAGDWVHVAYVWSRWGLPNDRQARYGVFVNGEYYPLTNAEVQDGPVTCPMAPGQDGYLAIGLYDADSNNQLRGVIDNLKVWDRPLRSFSERHREGPSGGRR